METFAIPTVPYRMEGLAARAGVALTPTAWLRTRGAGPRVADRRLRMFCGAAAVAVLALAATAFPLRTAPVTTVRPAPATVPGGLVQAIHSRLGPGPVALGSTPAAPTITAGASGWIVRVPDGTIRAVLAPSGTALVLGQGNSRASLTPTGLAGGAAHHTIGNPASSLRNGMLTQSYGVMSTSYQATRTGLEQRFEIPRAVDPRASSLTISLGSHTRWLVAAGGASLATSGRGSRLVYGDLRTTDRTGRVLPSHFVSGPGGPAIVVAAKGARYPITVDPTWVTISTPRAGLTVGTGRPGDYLGYAVSLSADGTTALVGAYGTNSSTGAAYLFQETAGGPWVYSSTPTAALTSATGAPGDRLGVSVSLSPDGTTAVVGADGAHTGQGAAYVFTAPSEQGWVSTSTPTAVLTDSTLAVDSYLGSAVAISPDGTTALVGAYGVGNGRGAAEIFSVPSKNAWTSASTPTAVLSDASSSSSGFLGYSVSLSADGTTALVGSFGSHGGRGSADVFAAASENAWVSTSTPAATLSDGQAVAGYYLGQSVSLSADGTTALVGAWGGAGGAGQADVFSVPTKTAWATTTKPTAILSNGSGAVGDRLGIAVALSANGTTALLGADQAGTTGAADVFSVTSESSWATTSAPTAVLTDSASRPLDLLGGAVAMSADGTTALVAPYGARTNTGAADVFVAAALPGAPVINSAVPGNAQATVMFTRPVSDGNAPITSYTVTATDTTNPTNGGQTATGTPSPLVVNGLTNGDSYTFTVVATNAVGTGPPSAPSKPIVPRPLAPRVTTVSPATLVAGSSQVPVVFTGLNFVTGVQLFPLGGGVQLTSVTVVDATTIDAVATTKALAATGPRNLTVSDPAGSTHCAGCITVAPAPTLVSMAPSTLAAGSMTTVTLNGSGIEAGALAHVKGVQSEVRFSSLSGTGTSATTKVTVAAGTAAGTYTVVLTNPDHSTATCTGCLTIP